MVNLYLEDVVSGISSGTTVTHKVEGPYVVYGSTGIIGYTEMPDYSGEKILVARVGANAGTTNFVSGEYGVSDKTLIVDVKSIHITKYIFFALKLAKLNQLVFGSGQPLITGSQLKQIKLYIPEEESQKHIVEVLSDINDLIGSLEKQCSKKKAIKQGAMQELLTGKRRLPGFDGKWQSFVFGDLFDFIPNNAFTRAQMDVSGRVKNIHYGDILTKYGAYISADRKDIPYIAKEIDLSRFSEKCYLQSGDLVIADTAEDETVGKALEVINVECPVLAGQHTLLCRPKVRFAEKFLGYYLNASCYHNQLLPYIVGTKVSSVSKASIAQTKLVVPKYEEQQAIASILSDMDDEITELEHKLAKYRQVKQGMMQQLLTGKIRLV